MDKESLIKTESIDLGRYQIKLAEESIVFLKSWTILDPPPWSKRDCIRLDRVERFYDKIDQKLYELTRFDNQRNPFLDDIDKLIEIRKKIMFLEDRMYEYCSKNN